MRAVRHLVRETFLAAFIALPLPGLAEVVARFDPMSGNVLITGLGDEDRVAFLVNPELLRLQVASLGRTRKMPITLQDQGATFTIKPRFALRSGNRVRA